MTGDSFETRIARCLAKHPEWSDYRVAKTIRGCISEQVKAVRMGAPLPDRKLPETGCSSGAITVAQAKARYDIMGSIQAEISKLPNGTLIPESELRDRVAKSDPSRFRRAIENNSKTIKTLRVKLKMDDDQEQKWYYGHPEDVAAIEAAKLL